jgi:hypothetical protein
MKNIILVIISAMFAFTVDAAGPGDSDIIWGKVSIDKELNIVISDLENITNRKGYDNQPSFSLDGKSVLFTAMFEGENQQTDIIQLAIKDCPSCKHHQNNVTNSPVSEYSPTPMDSISFTSVVVEPDNKQRIWKYSFNNSKAKPYLVDDKMEPVGYFAWGESQELAMFILGEPHTLQYKASKESQPIVIDTNIGRSVKTMPHTNWFSYIKEASAGKSANQARAFSAKDPSKTLKLIDLPVKAEYFNWHPRGILFSARDNTLVAADFSQWPNESAKNDWVDVVNTKSVCAGGSVTRIAFSQAGDQVAFVCQWP